MSLVHTQEGIHPTAIVHPGAVIGAGTTVGPYAMIGPDVVLGKGNKIGGHAVIEGYTQIGDENTIFQFASVGADPQDLKFRGEQSKLIIGSGNIIREGVTLQPGTSGGGMQTVIGSRNLFMAYSHVGHDGIVGDRNIFANCATLAGHVVVGNGVVIGGLAAIHQFVKLGDLAMIGGGAMVARDIPPFCMAQGDRAGLTGLNIVGIERNGGTKEEIANLKRLYREIFYKNGGYRNNLERVESEFSGCSKCRFMMEFLKSSERGVSLPRKKNVDDNQGL